jgi:hypothetical protein
VYKESKFLPKHLELIKLINIFAKLMEKYYGEERRII